MSDVLSREEINALLAAFSGAGGQNRISEDPFAKEYEGAPRNIKPYDFRRPDKFSKDQLRVIEMVHETYARHVSTILSGLLRAGVRVTLLGVAQGIYDEFLSKLRNPTVLNFISLSPLEGSMIMEMNINTAFVIIDRLLGGMGKNVMKPRDLTDIERSLIHGITTKMLQEFKGAWSHIIEMTPEIEGYEMNPQFAQVIPPNDAVCLVSFELKIGDSMGSMNICLPYSLLQPILPKLNAQQWFEDSRRVTVTRKGTFNTKALEKVKVPIIVQLGTVQISFSDLLGLQVGDVIKLDTKAKDELKIVIGGREKFSCVPGVRDNYLAVQITAVSDDKEE